MNKLYLIVIFCLVSVFSFCQIPLNQEGWTNFEPSNDTRIYYVDATNGNDATAEYVDANAVNDPQQPNIDIHPYKTIQAAESAARDGYPDWILLKQGEVWENESIGDFKSGRSATEPILIGHYGTASQRPLIKVASRFVNLNGRVRSHFAFVGLHIYAEDHDPKSPNFNSENHEAVSLRMVASGENYYFEDCKLEFVELIAQAYGGTGKINNVKVRRCIITDTYYHNSTNDNKGRPSGIYASEVHGLLIEECVFDHNGWNPTLPNARANMYNHNMYIQYGTSDVVVRNNIVSRGSANGVQLRGCGLVDDNFFIQNAVALNLGYHAHESEYDTIATAINNVIVEGRHMDPEGLTGGLSTAAVWGIWTSRERFLVENNIIANRISDNNGNAFPNDNGAVTTYVNNTVYDWDANRNMSDPGWLDPERDVSDYQKSLNKTESFEAFINEVRERPLHTWPIEYEASTINDFFREGFSVVPNNNPTADILGNTTGGVPFDLELTAQTSDIDGDDLAISWKLEEIWTNLDGSTKVIDQIFETSDVLNHTFIYPGIYKVSLTVYDGKGGMATSTKMIDLVGNYPPVARLEADKMEGAGPLFVTFDLSDSYDENPEDILTYHLNFDDGTNIITNNTSVSHVFVPGAYQVKLVVFDDKGDSSLAVIDIKVSDPQSSSVQYNINEDAFLSESETTSNFGSSINSLIRDGSGEGIFKVDFSANDEKVIGAKFYVPRKFGETATKLKFVSDDTWTEGTVTKENVPLANDLEHVTSNEIDGYTWFDVSNAAKNETDQILSMIMYQEGNVWREIRYKETNYAFPYLILETRKVTENSSPVAKIVSDKEFGAYSLEVAFDASQSTDSDDDQLTYQWDFGDASSTSNQEKVSHTFTESGEYWVSLIVSDGKGAEEGGVSVAQVKISVMDFVTETSVSDNSSMLVYPNPSSGIVHVQNSKEDIANVFSLTGELVASFVISSNESSIDLSNLTKGVYFLKIGEVNTKLIIQ